MRPISKLLFSENGFEQLESRIFERITFHIEINECTELACAAEERPKLGPKMSNSIGRGGRIHLRIQRGDFDREIYDREKLRIFSRRIGPVSCFARQFVQ